MPGQNKWIQRADASMERRGTKGALRASLGAKSGEPIPTAKLDKAAHSDNPTLRKRAQFALNVRK